MANEAEEDEAAGPPPPPPSPLKQGVPDKGEEPEDSYLASFKILVINFCKK